MCSLTCIRCSCGLPAHLKADKHKCIITGARPQAHAYPLGNPCYPAASGRTPACPAATATCVLANFLDISLMENVFGGPLYGYTQLVRVQSGLHPPLLTSASHARMPACYTHTVPTLA